jgi:protein phosphatase
VLLVLAIDALADEAKRCTSNQFMDLLINESRTEDQGKLRFLPSLDEVIVVGDLHGDLDSLTQIIKESEFFRKASEKNSVQLVFLGDYGDRGPLSPEVYYIILKTKQMFPQNVVLLRGNHEGPSNLIPSPHDLHIQLHLKYGKKTGLDLYNKLRMLFEGWPCVAVIPHKYVMVHAGLPDGDFKDTCTAISSLMHPNIAQLEEILWSDPREKLKGSRPSDRGAGKFFGFDVTAKWLKLLDVKVLIRGHEVFENGFEISHKGKVLTLFSSKNPAYRNEHAAYLQLDLSADHNSAYQLKRYIKQF